MITVILVIHLLIATALVGVILIQRSEGGALSGLGGGTPPLVVNQRLQGFEETLGYRVTPELTLRASHRARSGFGRPEYEHIVAVSAVWWRRWM